MGHRLTKIYTKKGDDGSTVLGDGSRTEKDSPRVQTIGDIDELNSFLGLLIVELDTGTELKTTLTTVQHQLFDLGGELSIPGNKVIDQGHVDELERLLDHFNKPLPPLKNFVLPGGNRQAALCHVCRSVCRRAERSYVQLRKIEAANAVGQIYLNRLSDLLFVAARLFSRREGVEEVMWKQQGNTSE